jgi:predicted dehydrogenase
MERLKVGVVGAGVGRLHLEGYKTLPKEVEIVALADADEARLNELGDAFSIPLRYTDTNQLFNSGEVEAVSLCLPNHLHAPVSIAALEAGLHVLCEKPLAENSASGQKIVEAAARATTKFMVCFNRRYRPDVQWMKQVLSSGKLGRIYQVRAGWIRETGIPTRTGWFVDKARAGGGPLIDLGVHILDLVMWLLDYPAILTISADVQANFGPHGRKVWYAAGDPKMPPFGVEDLATAFIRLANNISLQLETSWASHAKPGLDDFFITLMGTEGTIELYVANYAGENTLTYYTEVDGAPVAARPRIIARQIDHAYAVTEFVRSIRHDTPPPATAADGLIISNMIDAIYQSAAQRREIVLNLEKEDVG